ncbi:MAG: hypothetical protein AB7G28_10285 [Pirellulales bacterium]
MDEIKALREYAARTAADEPPPIDVTDRVLASIRAGRARQDRFSAALRPLMAAAAASLLVAATLSFVAQQAVAELHDPLVSLFTPWMVTLQ